MDHNLLVAELIRKGMDLDLAKLYAQKEFQKVFDSVNEDKPQFKVPKLSEKTRELFSFFRWYSNDDGTSAMYVRIDMDAEVYVLTSDPMTTASAVMVGGQFLEELMDAAYISFAMDSELSFLEKDDVNPKGESKSGPIMLPSLSEYWETVKKYWIRDTFFRLKETPCEISGDATIPTFLYWDSSLVRQGKHPSWDDWMECFPEYGKEIFRAWIASIFDPQNKGRQCMWIQDQGYTGKSSMIRALTRFMGKRSVAAVSKDSMHNQFGYSTVYGRRLVVYGDNKNPKLLHDSKIHSILGGDIVPIERKNVATFSAPVHSKILIGSNTPPEVDLGARSEVTRLLYIPLQEPPERVMARYCKTDEQGHVIRQKDGTPIFLGGNLEDKLFSEIPAFLYQCQQDYKRLCPNRMDIVVSEKMWDVLNSRCPSPEHLGIEKFVMSELSFGPGKTADPSDMMAAFQEFNKMNRATSFDFSRLKTYLETRHKVTNSHVGGVRLMVGVSIGTSPADLPEPVGIDF